MRVTTIIITILLLTLSIFTVPITPRVWAAQSSDPWRPYGPHTQKIQMQVYSGDTAEFTAFFGGQLDLTDVAVPAASESTCLGDPTCHLTSAIGSLNMFDVEFNLANTFWGVPYNFGNDPNGIHMRQAFAHLIDKSSFTTNSVLQGRAQAIDCPVPPAQGLACPNTAPWDPLFPNTISAYNIGPDSGMTAAPGSPDFIAAVQHLLAIRNAQGAQVFFDNNNDGIIDNPPSSRLDFFVRIDHPPRRQLGDALTQAINSMFGPACVASSCAVNEQLMTIAQVTGIVFKTAPAVFDWHVYTGGWTLGPFWDHLEQLYDSQFASNLCGGKKSSLAQNYIFACVPAFDTEARASIFASSFSQSTAHAANATDIFGRQVLTIPIYSDAGRMIYRQGWTGVINQLGVGVSNFFSLLNMRPDGVTPGVPAIPNTIRWGFKQGTTHLSMFDATTLWEFNVISEIYDTMLVANPLNNGQLTDWMTNRHQVFVNPTPEQIGYVPPAGTNTTIRFYLKNNLVFHDGVPLTSSDVMFSILNYRNVPSANLFPSVANVVDATALTPQIVDVHLHGISIFYELEIGTLPIIPQHLWDLNGDGVVDTAFISTSTTTFDPMTAGMLIGSGPFVCKNIQTGAIGGGCATNADGTLATQAVSVGGTFLLTKFDFSSFSNRHYQYMRSIGNWPASASGNFQEFSWADFTNDAKVDILDIASIAQCFNKPATGSCAYWDLPAPLGTTPGVVDIAELATVAQRFDENWVSPFPWTQLTGIDTFTP